MVTNPNSDRFFVRALLLFIIILCLFPFVLRSNKEILHLAVWSKSRMPSQTSSQSITKAVSPFLYVAFLSLCGQSLQCNPVTSPLPSKCSGRMCKTVCLKYLCVLCYSIQFCVQRFCGLCVQHGRHPDGLQRTVCAQRRTQLPVGGFPGPDPIPTTGNCESHTFMSCLGTVTRFITPLNGGNICDLQFSWKGQSL